MQFNAEARPDTSKTMLKIIEKINFLVVILFRLISN